MRRIALVCDWYSPRRGGIEAHLAGLAERLAAGGHEVHIITSTPGPTGSNDGVTIHRLAVRRLPWAGVTAQPVASMIGEILRRERIDIVHSHVSIVSPVALAGAFEADRRHIPAVITFHSFVPATPLLASIAGGLLGASKWRVVMTAVSLRVVREVESFAPETRFSVLPNAVDSGFWTPGPLEEPQLPVRLVYAGRLQRKKRPFLLIDVARRLHERGVAFQLCVVGDGPLRADLERRVRRAGLEGFVEFFGWRDRLELRGLLRSSHVFLSTATRESFGLAALEARAVGLPVVAMKDSAVADFISHEESGLLATDDAAFVAAAARLSTDERLRTKMCCFNREVKTSFDWAHSLALHEQAYDRAVVSRASR